MKALKLPLWILILFFALFSASCAHKEIIPPEAMAPPAPPPLPKPAKIALGSFQLQQLATSVDKGDIVDFVFPDNGFIKGERLAEFVNKKLQNTPMEELKIPFYTVATDIQNGE
ncbi:MAG: putative esterase of the alpha-beta hydrolase superfamily [Deltaproteobacteria bacterium]|nr:putative esterase of the alpha-beta hydrolase superfamily [Deltaproteobacteria bacterium]